LLQKLSFVADETNLEAEINYIFRLLSAKYILVWLFFDIAKR